VCAADVPIFKGQVGVSDGNYAIKISEQIERSGQESLEEFLESLTY
jgi:flagellar motor switch protein FliM